VAYRRQDRERMEQRPMELRLYDTLAREKRPFQPLDPNRVPHVCVRAHGLRLRHIGNARPAIVFDVLFRLLRHLYGAEHVTYVRNITDVDDKINARRRRSTRACRSTRRSAWSPKRPSSSTMRTWMRSAACARLSSRARPSTSTR